MLLPHWYHLDEYLRGNFLPSFLSIHSCARHQKSLLKETQILTWVNTDELFKALSGSLQLKWTNPSVNKHSGVNMIFTYGRLKWEKAHWEKLYKHPTLPFPPSNHAEHKTPDS